MESKVKREEGKWERMIREKGFFIYLSALHLRRVLGLAELAYLPFLSFPLVLSLITTEKTRAHEPTAILFSFFFAVIQISEQACNVSLIPFSFPFSLLYSFKPISCFILII